jgi:type VI secretion system protein ImpJ
MGTEPEVLWREGQFLCPQHLQSFARWTEARIHAAEDVGSPGSFGVISAAIDEEALQRDVFRLTACLVRLRDGALVAVPAQAQVDQRDVGEHFTGSQLDVFLGVPARRPGVPELGLASDSRARFHAAVAEVFDENLKDEPRELEVRVLHARVFFGTEERSGFECVPLARLVRKGKPVAVSALSDTFIPPLLACGGSAVLMRRLKEIADGVRAQARDLASRIPNTTGLSSVEKGADIAGFVKLQAVNQCVAVMDQIARLPALHPFTAYLALVQAVGNLSIFGAERVVPNLPVYDHGDLDRCFGGVIAAVLALIPAEVTVPYDVQPFREDPMRQGFFHCEVPKDWLAAKPLYYLGVELGKAADEVGRLVETGVKLLAEGDLERVLQGVVPGVLLEPVRTPPLAFPKRADLHYFRVVSEGASREGWLKIETSGTAVLLTALGGLGAKFHLYVELAG